MEKRLKFVVVLSLKEMALRRVTILLSNNSEISSPFYTDADWDFREFWKDWQDNHEDNVKYDISELLLPESLKKEMIDKVRPISLEIWKWNRFHKWTEISTEVIGCSIFYWTTAGTINYKKTAETLLGCEALDIKNRYELACFYCLEDYIPLLWEELVEDRKKYFLGETSVLPYLESYWPRILKGEFSDLDFLWRTDRNLTSFNQWAFEYWAKERNKTASDYFFRKLTHKEREASLKRTTLVLLSHPLTTNEIEIFYDFLSYYLSLMTPDQQMETIKEHPLHVLLCFYVMFWQDLLMENVGLIWPFLPTSSYGELLEKILYFVESERFHLKSFQEFFIMSPLDLKKYFVHRESLYSNFSLASHFLEEFFRRYDSDSIESVFRNLDVADRTALVFDSDLTILWMSSLRFDDGRLMVKACLREAKLSIEDRERLKKKRPCLKRVIQELNESDATAHKENKGQKRKLENCCSE